MSRLLLDTSAYSAAKRNHPVVVSLLEESDEILMTPIVIGELLAGFKKGDRFDANERDLKAFLFSTGVTPITIDHDTGAWYAQIHDYLRRAGTPVSPNDLWIAASAMQHGAQIITMDSDYQKIPQVMTLFLTE